jgi:hypothetical protein
MKIEFLFFYPNSDSMRIRATKNGLPLSIVFMPRVGYYCAKDFDYVTAGIVTIMNQLRYSKGTKFCYIRFTS